MTYDDSKTFTISGLIVRQTTNAVHFSDGINEEWIPKSLISDWETLCTGLVELTIPEWLAIERGFI